MESDLEPEEETNDSSVIKDLRRKLKQAEDAAGQTAKLQQENVILKAGLGSLSEKQLKALMAAHEGDLTAETVKATAVELGFTGTPSQSQEVGEPKGPSADELEAQRRVSDATSGAPGPKIDWNSRLAEAKTQDEAMKIIREAEAAGKMVSHHGD